MELSGARTLVAGATGVLGGALARSLHAAGAQLVLAGRDHPRLLALSHELGGVPIEEFEALDLERCAAVAEAAADRLGGLDLVVVAFGVAAFGAAEDIDDLVSEQLLAVNLLAPMAMVRAAVPRMAGSGTIAVLTAILADLPTAGMAAYSASKAGLSAWLTALRAEQRRRGITVYDVRPPHVETGLARRAVAGTAPTIPARADVDELVGLVRDGIIAGHRELRYDVHEQAFRSR